MTTVTLARNAMATRFEVVLHGQDPVQLRAAAEEALTEIERLEAQLSLFRPSSEIAHLNARAAKEPVQVTPVLFALLQQARSLSLETGGAFDITIAPLVRRWGFLAGAGRRPSAVELAEARACVGMEHVLLSAEDYTVRFDREGVMLDLGAIGKGYAIDKAVELLREAEVASGVLHGGTSTIYAIGAPPDADAWRVALPLPSETFSAAHPLPQKMAGNPVYSAECSAADTSLTVSLKNEALSVSAVWGRFFEESGETLGHIIDPRTGCPAQDANLAAVALASATESDALSTALLTLGIEGHEKMASLRPAIRTLVGTGRGKDFRYVSARLVE